MRNLGLPLGKLLHVCFKSCTEEKLTKAAIHGDDVACVGVHDDLARIRDKLAARFETKEQMLERGGARQFKLLNRIIRCGCHQCGG